MRPVWADPPTQVAFFLLGDIRINRIDRKHRDLLVALPSAAAATALPRYTIITNIEESTSSQGVHKVQPFLRY